MNEGRRRGEGRVTRHDPSASRDRGCSKLRWKKKKCLNKEADRSVPKGVGADAANELNFNFLAGSFLFVRFGEGTKKKARNGSWSGRKGRV